MNDSSSRRTFLRAAVAAGAAWAVADLVEVEEALAWAAQQSAAGQTARTSVLTRAQADLVDAVMSRIIPAVDGRAGAREAGARFFVDRSLATFNAGRKGFYLNGLADLDRRASALVTGAGFTGLSAVQQDDVLRGIEQTPFFQAIRFDAIVGTFALPTWGGNREYVGWHMIGFEHQPRFQAPFGAYDIDANRRG